MVEKWILFLSIDVLLNEIQNQMTIDAFRSFCIQYIHSLLRLLFPKHSIFIACVFICFVMFVNHLHIGFHVKYNE